MILLLLNTLQHRIEINLSCAVVHHFSCFRPFETPWTTAHRAPLSTGFFRQEHRGELPCPLPGDLPHPGTEPTSPQSPALQVDSFSLSHWRKPQDQAVEPANKPVEGSSLNTSVVLFTFTWYWSLFLKVQVCSHLIFCKTLSPRLTLQSKNKNPLWLKNRED